MPRLPTNSESDDDEIQSTGPGNAAQNRDVKMNRENGASSDGEENDKDAGAGSDDEGDPDEFIVQKIIDHFWDPDDRCWKFQTVWEDYPDPADYTWEPAENLEGAQDILDEYYESIGGNPALKQPKKRGRKAADSATPVADSKSKGNGLAKTPNDTSGSTKRQRRNSDLDDPSKWGPGGVAQWHPPRANKDAWEELIENIETIEPDQSDEKWAFVRWVERDNHGHHRKSRERLQTVYRAAPQVMLRFYERHLVFGKGKSD